TAVPQSTAPVFKKINADAELEYRFELNYELAPSEPSRMLIDSLHPEVVIFQLNIRACDKVAAIQMIPEYLFEYYDTPEKFTPLLCLSLIEYMYQNRGDLQDDRGRVATIIQPLRQFSLSMLLGQSLEMENPDFSSGMVGVDRIKELFRAQCRRLYPDYKTLILGKNWQTNIQQYRYALERIINQEGISIARGRNEWKTTKNDMADSMRIPGKSMTRLEVLVKEMAEMGLLEIINFSGRQAYSEVTFKFKMHPLESDWLILLDASKEHLVLQGVKVQAITPEILLARARKMGYTEAEQHEVIQLMRARKYIELEPKKNLLYRTIDTIDTFIENVQAMLNRLEVDIRTLCDAIGDFDEKPYLLLKAKSDLEAAKERDQVEQVRDKIREWEVGINAFVGSRSSSIRQKITDEQNKLHELNRQGIPLWVNYAFEPNPLLSQLEKQRSNRVLSYQNTLDDTRKVREASIRSLQEISGNNVEILVKLYALLRELTEKSNRLCRRIEGLRDEQQDMVVWREVAKLAENTDAKARSIKQTYDYNEFLGLAEQLWKTLQDEFEEDPLSNFSKHQNVKERIQLLDKRIAEWVENRRRDFEQKCQGYQVVLNQAGIQIELKVPFDPEHPAASVDALIDQVCTGLQRYLNILSDSISQAATTIKYSIKVQKLPLEKDERQAYLALQMVDKLQKVLTVEMLRDFDTFRDRIIQLLVKLSLEEKTLRTEVQGAIKKRPPEGTEVRLMSLLKTRQGGHQIDLRGLIIGLIEQGEDDVNLEKLMADLESLFQKNQISIHLDSMSSNETDQ
ncbi:hypothetical protein MEO93_25320, partial [Dolichospermum sp. ST_sed3]|nr:hypothetical protein [Dolichospermum sp. ST_sed3]